ncbi:MAG TPA: hypothetical protein PKA19_13095 [Bacillota bacterium]|nr:hypothetical protein [Bacillota bacterium]
MGCNGGNFAGIDDSLLFFFLLLILLFCYGGFGLGGVSDDCRC